MATLVHIKDLFQFVCFGLLLLDICSGKSILIYDCIPALNKALIVMSYIRRTCSARNLIYSD